MTIEDSLSASRRVYGRAIRHLLNAPPNFTVLEDLRHVAQTARGTMDILEEGPTFDAAHRLLDHVGGAIYDYYRRDHCHLQHDGAHYLRTCDVDLGHFRMGFSPGYIVRKAECSVCEQDPDGCDHIRGYEYDGNVCVRRVLEADVLEVSWVERPSQPEARLTSLSGPSVASLGGDQAVCRKCANPCTGLRYPMRQSSPPNDLGLIS